MKGSNVKPHRPVEPRTGRLRGFWRRAKSELLWLLPRLVVLVAVTTILHTLQTWGYLPEDIYGLAMKIWMLAYIFFGVEVFQRYILGPMSLVTYRFLSRYAEGKSERRKIQSKIGTYMRIPQYTVYVIAILVGVNQFFDLSAVWSALSTTFLIIATFFIGLFTSSVLGNLIAHEALRQSGGISIGDRVEIKDKVYGDVVSRGPFFVKVKTIKDEMVTVPNLELVNNSVTNYSAYERVIIHVPVTLGYNVDKELAKKLLIDAARRTKYLLFSPNPFVLLLELGNYTVTYEINAYTNRPNDIINIKSELIENVIDIFNANKIEILSPAFTVFRTQLESRPGK